MQWSALEWPRLVTVVTLQNLLDIRPSRDVGHCSNTYIIFSKASFYVIADTVIMAVSCGMPMARDCS